MLASVSVVIPTLNAESHLPGNLSSLAPGLGAGLIKEAIVVDGGSQDRTIEIACDAGCRVISSPKGRGRQLRTGGVNARGDWLLFLHADTRLADGWVDALRDHMQRPERAAAFKLVFDSDEKQARWLERRAALRVRLLGLPYGDQGLFIHKNLYFEIGGFTDQPLMEDVDIIRRIGRRRLDILDVQAVTAADKYERDGWRKRAWRNAFLLIRYFLGASPAKLARSYD